MLGVWSGRSVLGKGQAVLSSKLAIGRYLHSTLTGRTAWRRNCLWSLTSYHCCRYKGLSVLLKLQQRSTTPTNSSSISTISSTKPIS